MIFSSYFGFREVKTFCYLSVRNLTIRTQLSMLDKIEHLVYFVVVALYLSKQFLSQFESHKPLSLSTCTLPSDNQVIFHGNHLIFFTVTLPT